MYYRGIVDFFDNFGKRIHKLNLLLNSSQNGLFQNVQSDAVFGTLGFGFISIGSALVVHKIFGCMPHHAFPAISTADKTGKQIYLLFARRGPGVPPVQALCRLKGILVDDGRYSIFHNEPFLFRYSCSLVDLITDNLLPSLAHYANVQRILEHTRNR